MQYTYVCTETWVLGNILTCVQRYMKTRYADSIITVSDRYSVDT